MGKHPSEFKNHPFHVKTYQKDKAGQEALLKHLEQHGKMALQAQEWGLSSLAYHYNGATVSVQFNGKPIPLYFTELEVVSDTDDTAQKTFNELEQILLKTEPVEAIPQ